ncbi:unnamed protein product [Caenorhabditis sp. 36 PRJEB53466]|nr:unnamed protein product [Caenorhabditis sp. 36 PRJEB53466]
MKLENCGGETLDSINEIEKKFWAPGSNYSATFLEHVAMDTEEGLAKEDTYFTMYVGLGTYEEMATETEGGTESQGDKFTSLEATWKFYIQWVSRTFKFISTETEGGQRHATLPDGPPTGCVSSLRKRERRQVGEKSVGLEREDALLVVPFLSKDLSLL